MVSSTRNATSAAGKCSSGAFTQLLRDGAWALLGNFGTKVQAVSLVLAGIGANGLSGVGLLAALYGSVVLAASLADFGYSTEASRALASQPTLLALTNLIRGTAIRGPVAVVAACLLCFASSDPANSNSAVLYAAVGVAAISYYYSNFSILCMYGLRAFRLTAVVGSSIRVCGAFVIVLVSWTSGITNGFAAVAGSELATAVAMAVFLKRLSRELPCGQTRIRSRAYMWLGFGTIINTLVNRADAVLISTAASTSAVGSYALASQVENAVTTAALTPASPLATHIARTGADASSEHPKLVLKVGILVAVLALAASSAVVLLMSVPVVSSALSDLDPGKQLPSVILICLLGAPCSAAAAVVMAASFGRARYRGVATAWLLIGVVSVPAMYCLAAAMGAVGAAAGALIRSVMMLLAAIFACRVDSRELER